MIREGFLYWSLILAAAGYGLAACDGKPLPKPPSEDTATPIGVLHDLYLAGTATQLAVENKDTSFEPHGPFTPEYFEKVRRSTVSIIYKFPNAIGRGTGFVPRTENNMTYIVSTFHGVGDHLDQLQWIEIWRPGLDKGKDRRSAEDLVIATDPEHDQLVIGIPQNTPLFCCFDPIASQDNSSPLPVGNEALLYGFPQIFERVAADPSPFFNDYRGHAQYLLRTTENAQMNGLEFPEAWAADSIGSIGDSGAPVTIPDDEGNPLVIALFRATNYVGGDTLFTINVPLHIQPLLDRIIP